MTVRELRQIAECEAVRPRVARTVALRAAIAAEIAALHADLEAIMARCQRLQAALDQDDYITVLELRRAEEEDRNAD